MAEGGLVTPEVLIELGIKEPESLRVRPEVDEGERLETVADFVEETAQMLEERGGQLGVKGLSLNGLEAVIEGKMSPLEGAVELKKEIEGKVGAVVNSTEKALGRKEETKQLTGELAVRAKKLIEECGVSVQQLRVDFQKSLRMILPGLTEKEAIGAQAMGAFLIGVSPDKLWTRDGLFKLDPEKLLIVAGIALLVGGGLWVYRKIQARRQRRQGQREPSKLIIDTEEEEIEPGEMVQKPSDKDFSKKERLRKKWKGIPKKIRTAGRVVLIAGISCWVGGTYLFGSEGQAALQRWASEQEVLKDSALGELLERVGVDLDATPVSPVTGRQMSLPELLDYEVNNPDGALGLFRSGMIHLNFLHPWNDRSMWKVVAGGGALDPFVKEQDAYIDGLFDEDVKTGSMTKGELEALLWRAKDKGLMTEDDVLFYLIRWQYGDDAEGFYKLLEEGPEALRKLQSGGDTSSFGRTDLSRGEVVARQRELREEMRLMARRAR